MSKPTCREAGCERPEYNKTYGLCQKHYRVKRKSGEIAPIYVAQGDQCSVDGCDAAPRTKGLCAVHYNRFWRYGSVDPRPDERRPTGYSMCTWEGCERPHHGGGLCAMHAKRRSEGRPMDGPPQKISRAGACEGPECDRPILAKRLCSGHYDQQRRGESLTPIREYVPKGGPCKVTGCDIPATVEGMCRTHRRRFLAGEDDWDRPVKRYAPPGSGHLGKDGYRHLSVNGRRVLEHRLIAEQVLGRPLLPTEEVHHDSTDRADNRTDGPFRLNADGRLQSGNLVIWKWNPDAGRGKTGRQWRGGDIGPQLDAARRLLAQYGEAT